MKFGVELIINEHDFSGFYFFSLLPFGFPIRFSSCSSFVGSFYDTPFDIDSKFFFPHQFETHVFVSNTWARIKLKTERNVPIGLLKLM